MRNNPPSLHLVFTSFLDKPDKSVECPARLERADALVVLAFEEEVDGWVCRCLAFEGRALEGVGGLRG